MKRITMMVAGRPYVLAPGQSVEDIRAAIVEAVRAGGDLVSVAIAGGLEVDMLVSPGVPILFESRDIPEVVLDDSHGRESFPSFPHFDPDY